MRPRSLRLSRRICLRRTRSADLRVCIEVAREFPHLLLRDLCIGIEQENVLPTRVGGPEVHSSRKEEVPVAGYQFHLRKPLPHSSDGAIRRCVVHDDELHVRRRLGRAEDLKAS